MRKYLSNPLIVFLLAFLVITLPLIIFPINLFDGEIVQSTGMGDVTIQARLSLSYFIGLGYNPADLEGIKDFYLVPKGYMIAFIVLIGIPGLIAYRVYISGNQEPNRQQDV
jgi:hypothetical protein